MRFGDWIRHQMGGKEDCSITGIPGKAPPWHKVEAQMLKLSLVRTRKTFQWRDTLTTGIIQALKR